MNTVPTPETTGQIHTKNTRYAYVVPLEQLLAEQIEHYAGVPVTADDVLAPLASAVRALTGLNERADGLDRLFDAGHCVEEAAGVARVIGEIRRLGGTFVASNITGEATHAQVRQAWETLVSAIAPHAEAVAVEVDWKELERF